MLCRSEFEKRAGGMQQPVSRGPPVEVGIAVLSATCAGPQQVHDEALRTATCSLQHAAFSHSVTQLAQSPKVAAAHWRKVAAMRRPSPSCPGPDWLNRYCRGTGTSELLTKFCRPLPKPLCPQLDAKT